MSQAHHKAASAHILGLHVEEQSTKLGEGLVVQRLGEDVRDVVGRRDELHTNDCILHKLADLEVTTGNVLP